jgi:hypothetical protein
LQPAEGNGCKRQQKKRGHIQFIMLERGLPACFNDWLSGWQQKQRRR